MVSTTGNSIFSMVSTTGNTIFYKINYCTERNKWYILTHLGKSSYCPQINQNYQVNSPRFLWNPRRRKPEFTPQPASQFTVPLRSVGSNLHSDIAFLWKFVSFLFILHCYERIYKYTVLGMYVLDVLVLFYKVIYRNLLTSILLKFHSDSNPRSICSAAWCSNHYTKRPGGSIWYFWLYAGIFINFDIELIIKYFSVVQLEI